MSEQNKRTPEIDPAEQRLIDVVRKYVPEVLNAEQENTASNIASNQYRFAETTLPLAPYAVSFEFHYPDPVRDPHQKIYQLVLEVNGGDEYGSNYIRVVHMTRALEGGTESFVDYGININDSNSRGVATPDLINGYLDYIDTQEAAGTMVETFHKREFFEN